MSVLTEITNSDKDILLSGDCTIKTKLITSKERLPIQIYDGIYDSQNDSYYILGESTQETRSGKNLYNAHDMKVISNTASVDSDDWITINYDNTNGSSVAYSNCWGNKSNLLETSTTYALFVEIKEVSGNGTLVLTSGPSYPEQANQFISYSFNDLAKGMIKKAQFVTKDDFSNVYYMLRSFVSIKKGSSASITFRISVIKDTSLTINNFKYEPYGVMPSPDYPSEIKSISGAIGIKTKEDTVVVVDLEDNELCGINVKDKLTIKDGKATITKNIGDLIYTGADDENWIIGAAPDQTNTLYVVSNKYDNIVTGAKGMSNLFAWTAVWFNDTEGFQLSNQIHSIRVRINKTTAESIAAFKTWLGTHNLHVKGELKTPQEITLTNVNTYTIQTLTEENSVKDWEISDDRYVENNGVIGQFVARDISGNLQNISDDFNIENDYVQVQMGISQFNSKITNWYSLGSFLIIKPSDDEVSDNTKYNGYDLATLFNIDFNPKYVNKDFPKSFNQMLKEQNYVTNKWLANYVCAQVEVELATQDFIHNDFKVLSNQFTSGESCRDVMRYIAQLAFGYCEIGWDDKCYIRTLINDYSSFDDYHKLNYDTYYNLETQKNEYGPINRVFCGLQDVNGQGKENIDKSTIENGVTTINIYNNPLTMGTTLEISEQLRAQVVKDCDVLWGIKYRPITNMETIGHPWFKANEPIQVSDMENKTFITYPFNNTLKYTGHIKSEISSEGTTKAEDTYGYKDSVERRMNCIGINVDRANEKITIINQKITQIGDDIEDIRGNMIEIGDVYTKSEIRDIVSGVGVDGTVVTSVETATTIFDINGMTVGRTDSPTKTNINSNGMIITNANDNTELLKINNSGVYSENLTARTYLNFGTHGRFEKYTENNRTRIGCFWIEGDD